MNIGRYDQYVLVVVTDKETCEYLARRIPPGHFGNEIACGVMKADDFEDVGLLDSILDEDEQEAKLWK